jgi:hypothetical protein
MASIGSLDGTAAGAGAVAAAADAPCLAGRSAERPLPSTFRCLSATLFIFKDFLRQSDVAFGSLRAGVIHEDGFAVARGLGQADAAGDYRLQNVIAEEFLQVVCHLAGQIGPVVIHGEQYTFQLEGPGKGLDRVAFLLSEAIPMCVGEYFVAGDDADIFISVF